jgi:hypothetical protein
MSTWRVMAGDLEDQVECPVIALAVLAKFGADLDRAAANDLGPLHVGIPFSKPALIRYVRERFVHR